MESNHSLKVEYGLHKLDEIIQILFYNETENKMH